MFNSLSSFITGIATCIIAITTIAAFSKNMRKKFVNFLLVFVDISSVSEKTPLGAYIKCRDVQMNTMQEDITNMRESIKEMQRSVTRMEIRNAIEKEPTNTVLITHLYDIYKSLNGNGYITALMTKWESEYFK